MTATSNANTAVGYEAGSSITTQGGNTNIGYKSTPNVTALLNTTSLGANSQPTSNLNIRITTGQGNTSPAGSTCNIDALSLFVNANFYPSDRRVKKNIRDVPLNILQDIDLIDLKMFERRDFLNTQIGVIAQALPESLQQYLITRDSSRVDRLSTQEKYEANIQLLGINKVCDMDTMTDWKNHMSILAESKHPEVQETEEYQVALRFKELDWDLVYFKDFYNVDYTILATMTAIKVNKENKELKAKILNLDSELASLKEFLRSKFPDM